MRTFLRTLFIALVYVVTSAHVGSPDTWFEGKAGPYHLTVQIQPAGVVPGVATVYVRATGDIPQTVTIQANKFDATGGAPPPEPAPPVEGETGAFSGRLWVMSGGSNSVTVSASGPKGSGSVVVPVVIVAYSRLELDKPMGAGLLAMGLFLFVGLVTIVGAAVREGPLGPDQAPTPAMNRRARNAMALTSVIVVLLLAGGWRWWNAEDRNYARSMYKPLASRAAIEQSEAGDIIEVSIADSAWIHRRDTAWLSRNDANAWTPLIDDHGKIMHLFLIRDDLNAFAHLHPETRDSVVFSSAKPPLPAGRYKVFADIVHESGFTHTLTSTLTIGDQSRSPVAMGNADDSWLLGSGAGAARIATIDSGATMEWQIGAGIVEGKPATLRFNVRNADGSPARLEPYMGMPAHAVVARDDGSVFVHLHPMGTISMASQTAFTMRQPGDTVPGTLAKRLSAAEMPAMQNSPVTVGTISFPYAFPKPGNYRIWVQVKLGGKVTTAAFDARVTAADTRGTK
jgi:hypothetical protein